MVVGGDIGTYAMVRAFHEAFGVRGVVVAKVATRAFASTRLADLVIADVDDPDTLVSTLLDIARSRPDDSFVLLTNADWYVELLVSRRAELEEHFAMPLCSREVFERVSAKESFQADCEALGIPVPRTIPVRFASGAPVPDGDLASLTYPVIGKASSSAEMHYVTFAGKRKVHHLDSRESVDALLSALARAGFTGTYLLQEFIPGDETQTRSLTAYRNAAGEITLLCTGRVLLEEHTPGTLGIPAAILTTPYEDAMAAMSAYLHKVGYRGFANADYKWDARTGRHVFFEVNPRIGRNNFYVTASGINIARHVTADALGQSLAPEKDFAEVLYSVVPVTLLKRYLLDGGLKRRVLAAARRGVARPLHAPADFSVRRWLVIWGLTLNFWRKYRQYYWRPTPTGH